MALDLHRHTLAGFGIHVGASTLNHIRIQRALGEVIEGAKALALLFKHTDEFRANDFALLLWVCDAIKLLDKPIASIDVLHMNIEFAIKELHQEFRLAFAHKALIDKHAGELISNRFLQ